MSIGTALKDQIPLSNESETRSNKRSNKPHGDSHEKYRDGLYARARRMEARISALENTLSALRRDVNRIDRANYRKAGVSGKVVESPVEKFIGGIRING